MERPLRKLEASMSTLEDLDAVLRKERRVMLVFHASWCRPCKVYGKTIEKFQTTHDVPLCHVDVDSARELTQKFGVMSVPCTLVLEADMSVKKEVNGVVEEQALHKLVDECFCEAS